MIYLDQDGVIADFNAGAEAHGLHPADYKLMPLAYRHLPVYAGALEGVARLSALVGAHNLWIATKIPTHNPLAATEKLLWLGELFPQFRDRFAIIHDKSLLGTPEDYLVDDRPHKANARDFRGTLLHFGPQGDFPDWPAVLNYFQAVRLK